MGPTACKRKIAPPPPSSMDRASGVGRRFCVYRPSGPSPYTIRRWNSRSFEQAATRAGVGRNPMLHWGNLKSGTLIRYELVSTPPASPDGPSSRYGSLVLLWGSGVKKLSWYVAVNTLIHTSSPTGRGLPGGNLSHFRPLFNILGGY